MMMRNKLLFISCLLCLTVAVTHAIQPSSTSHTESLAQQIQPPKMETQTKSETDGDSDSDASSKVEHRFEWEDTEEYVFLVCARKLLKGPKGFCERENVKAILPDLQKVPKSKPQSPEEVFKSHRDGEATLFSNMLVEKGMDKLMALGDNVKSALWHKANKIAKSLGEDTIATLMIDADKDVDGSALASKEAGDSDNVKNAAKKTKFRSQLGKVQNDLSLIERRTTVRSTAEMVTPYKRPWKNAVVHYEFEGVSPTQRATLYGMFLEAIWKYQNNTCVRFEPKQVGTTRFTTLAGGPGAEGSFSRGLGNSSSRVQIASTMTDQKVVDHEFGHLLGLLHTNKRKDRNDWVIVDRTKCDNYFRKYVKRVGEFQLDCQKYYKRWQTKGWLKLRGGFINTWTSAPTAGIKAAFTTFDAKLTAWVRAQKKKVKKAKAHYDSFWKINIFNYRNRQAAWKAYVDAKSLYDLGVSDLAEWDDLKKRVMKWCLDGWYYQYEQDPKATDHGATYDYKSIMHYPFDTREPTTEQCMMPKNPNKDNSPIPPNVGSYDVNNNDYAAVRANLGCQSSVVYVCSGSTNNCPKQAVRSMHHSWNMKDTMEVLQSDYGFEIPAKLEKKEGGTWSTVNFQPTDTLGSLGLIGKPLRICDGC